MKKILWKEINDYFFTRENTDKMQEFKNSLVSVSPSLQLKYQPRITRITRIEDKIFQLFSRIISYAYAEASA